MGELELVGLHEDGEHLVLSAPDGQRYRLRIDEPLRAAVRRDRPQLEQLRAERTGALSPREIQARIRAGATADEVAEAADVPVESVRRYEGPVLAERDWVAEQARGTRVGKETDAPLLGDLVTDRLAARGVDVSSLAWDASRQGNGPWSVVARFVVPDGAREARWTYDPVGRAVVAEDDEARWLSETEIEEPAGRRHLAAVRDVVFDIDAVGGEPAEEPTHALLDELRTRRGVRQPLELETDDEEFEGFGPPHAFDLAGTPADGRAGGFDPDEPPGAHPEDADPRHEAVVLTPPRGARLVPGDTAAPTDEDVPHEDTHHEPTADERAQQPAERRGRRTRAKVPSWDEIVFGAKPE